MIDSNALGRQIDDLEVIDSIAVMSVASSTNALAHRVIDECIENDIPVPNAMIIAREQRAGRGREGRSWVSPRNAGIWATLLTTCSNQRLALLPLEMSLCVSRYLESMGLTPRIKWPNDILIGDRKIAGILIEARSSATGAHVAIGVGINLTGASPHEGGITAEEAGATGEQIDEAILAWCRAADRMLAEERGSAEIIREWSERSSLQTGDRVASLVGGRSVEGSWQGIDSHGHARITTADGERKVAAGEIVALDRG